VTGLDQLQHAISGAAIMRPGDTLVVGIAGHVTAEEGDRARNMIRSNLPGVDVFLVSNVSQLVVYRPAELPDTAGAGA
jgi:hypothetical protein